MIKYVIRPGWIPSKNDHDRHFISGPQLIHLYHLNPAECYIADPDEDLRRMGLTDKQVLGPRYHGDYSLP